MEVPAAKESNYSTPNRPRSHPSRQHAVLGEKGEHEMKSVILAIVGVCAAAAGLLVWGSKRTPGIEELGRQLEDPGRGTAA